MNQERDHLYALIGVLDDARGKVLKNKISDISAAQREYTKNYYLQIGSYNLNNKTFGNNKRPMEPQAYNELLEQELNEEAQRLDREQRDEDEKKEKGKEEKTDREDKGGAAKEVELEQPQRIAFLEETGKVTQADEMQSSPAPEKAIHPRRIAFLENMGDVTRSSDKADPEQPGKEKDQRHIAFLENMGEITVEAEKVDKADKEQVAKEQPARKIAFLENMGDIESGRTEQKEMPEQDKEDKQIDYDNY